MDMEKIVASIEEALDKGCFLPALALTLTIPDICAQLDYPEIYHKKEEYDGHWGQGGAYAKWYDENIAKYETTGRNDFKDHINGRHCWKLRCGFLHNGEIDLDKCMRVENEEVKFTFISSEVSSYWTMGGISSISHTKVNGKKSITHIELDIVNFCSKILAVFKYSYLSNDAILKKLEQKQLHFIELA